MNKMTGMWYEQERDKLFTFEMGQECSTAHYKAKDNGTIDLYYRSQIPLMFNQYMGRGGNLQQCGLNDRETCKVDMGNADKVERKLKPFEMLATDYDNWHVIYACMDLVGSANLMYGNWFAIYTRYNTPITDEHLEAAHAALKKRLPDVDLTSFGMHTTSQENCEYDWTRFGI